MIDGHHRVSAARALGLDTLDARVTEVRKRVEPATSEFEINTHERLFAERVRNIPAALYKGLGGFATNGVNLRKLESYMVGVEFKATEFYAEVDGHPEEPDVARALEELRFFSDQTRILGVYPAHRGCSAAGG